MLKKMWLFICVLLLSGQVFSYDMDEVIKACQQMKQDDDSIALVWPIPEALLEEMGMPNTVPGTLLVALKGDSNLWGNINYATKSEMSSNLSMYYNGVTYKPVNEKEINAETRAIIGLMQPIFQNMLGTMGSNMYFFMFDKKVDFFKDQDMTIKLFDERYEYELPLPALLDKKRCSKTNKEYQGNYIYCPIHGNRLK